jgi:hypothetical protein
MTPQLDTVEYFWSSLRSCTEYAIKFQRIRPDLTILLLDELSRTGDTLFGSRGYSGNTWLQDIIDYESTILFSNPGKISHWTGTEFMRPGLELGTTSFFGYAFHYPLPIYVEHKLSNSLMREQIAGHSLLYTAAIARNTELVELLLNAGADPNMYENQQTKWTTWEHILWRIRKAEGETFQNPEGLAEIIRLFFQYGADVRAGVDGLKLDDLIRDRLRAWDAERAEALLGKILKAKKSMKKPKGSEFKGPEPSSGIQKLPETESQIRDSFQSREPARRAQFPGMLGPEHGRSLDKDQRLDAAESQGYSMVEPRSSTLHLPGTRFGSRHRSNSRILVIEREGRDS